MAIVRYSLAALKKHKSKTDWRFVRGLREEDIQEAEGDFNISENNTVSRGALIGRPKKDIVRSTVTLRIPDPLIERLKNLGKGWNTRASLYLERGILKGNV